MKTKLNMMIHVVYNTEVIYHQTLFRYNNIDTLHLQSICVYWTIIVDTFNNQQLECKKETETKYLFILYLLTNVCFKY